MTRTVLLYDVSSLEMYPWVAGLLASGVECVMNGTALRQRMRADGQPLHCWEDFQPSDLSGCVEREIMRIANGVSEALSTHEGVVAFETPRGNLLRGSGQRLFEQVLGMFSRQIALIETFDRLRSERDVGLVVLGCDNNHLERTLVGAARRAGIPSLQLAHGLNGPVRIRIAGEMHTVYADEVAVYGERARRNLIASGNVPDRIHMTGAPAWDALYGPTARIDAAEARRRLGLDPHRPTVLFLPTCWHGSSSIFGYNVQRFAETTKVLLGALRQRAPLAQLLIRPHPGERLLSKKTPAQTARWLREYESWIRAHHGVDARVIQDRKVEVIRASDVAITPGSSTVIPELMILERPVIRVRGWEGDDLYGETDGVQVVEREGLADALARALGDRAARDAMLAQQAAALPDLNFKSDGRASERVVDLILAKLNASPARGVPEGRGFLHPVVAWHRADPADEATETQLIWQLKMRDIELTIRELGDASPADASLVHVFGSARQLLAIAERSGAAKLVWTPTRLPWIDESWLAQAIRAIYGEKCDTGEREAYLMALADGSLEVDGALRGHPNLEHQRARLELRAALARADFVCVGSMCDARYLLCEAKPPELRFRALTPAVVTPGDGGGATKRCSLADAVLCTGAIEPRGNQLLLLEALRPLGLRAVLDGAIADPEYADLCRKVGGYRIAHLGPLTREARAVAQRGAACVVSAGFAQTAGIALLRAALERRPLVIGHDHGQIEQLDTFAMYCDPFDVASIRNAVERGLNQPAERWGTLCEILAKRCAPASAADALAALYDQTLGATS